MERYPFAPEQWAKTPIQRGINPKTGLIEGDDTGYRNVATLKENGAPLVVPDVTIRASYDGRDEFGFPNPDIALDGGLRDGKLVVRETVARELEDANRVLGELTGGNLELCAVDGFRSWRRQAAGFTRMLRLQMDRANLHEDEVDVRIPEFITCGNAADGTFSWVNADVQSEKYKLLAGLLHGDKMFMEQLATCCDASDLKAVDEAIYTYITIAANANMGHATDRGIPLVFENNAHAGGAAADIMVLNRTGAPMNIVPFDYHGPEAGMGFMEDDANYERFIEKASRDHLLRRHLDRLGFSPVTKFSMRDWIEFREVMRILYHLTKAKGWTYYSSDHGGENWHFEPGNVGYDARTGGLVCREAFTADRYPDSGNPGHALQKHGKEGVAVWGGASGHKIARESHGLED